jgi:hypothetical protein
MTNQEKISQGLQALFEGRIQTVPAVVEAVDEDAQTCEVKPLADSYAPMKSVRLKAAIDKAPAGIVIIPEIGSTVLVSLIMNSDQRAFVSLFTDIKKAIIVNASGYYIGITDEAIEAKAGDSKLTIEEDKVTINDGSLKGLVKIEELKTQLQKNSDSIQAIIDVFSNWTPTANDGGKAAAKVASDSLATKQVGVWDDIENDKVLHG